MTGHKHHAASGFSLIELIVVIVILSILAVFGSQFVITTTQNYEQTRTRALLVNTGRQALERMSRQLRGALPYSVIATDGNTCIKFMPIAGGGIYLTPVPDSANNASASASIDVTNHLEEFGSARWVSIGALAANEIYAPAPSVVGLAARTGTNLTLAASTSWQRNSINRRFYLLDNAQAFCVVGSQLHFYPNAGMALISVDQSGTFDLMANNVSAGAFNLTTGTEDRNTIAVINLDFTSGGETVNFQQQVMIRNVP